MVTQGKKLNISQPDALEETMHKQPLLSDSMSTGITCFDASVTCDPIPVFVEGDPTNTMYRLESNCIPEGWYETTFEFIEECE